MLDPSPAGEKPWDRASCEHYVSVKDAAGPGYTVVLADPAPAKMGSTDTRSSKARGDGTKDDWAIAVLKIRRNGQRYEVCLLDGRRSKSWDMSAGFDVQNRLFMDWKASAQSFEASGSVENIYDDELRKSCKRVGVSYRREKLIGSNRADAKNVYFAALASSASSGEFTICQDTCDKDFLKYFLDQAREWRPMDGGKNGLRYDDCANVVSMAFDPAFRTRAPMTNHVTEWSPYKPAEVDRGYEHGGRYVRW
jgi:hypothetical protein